MGFQAQHADSYIFSLVAYTHARIESRLRAPEALTCGDLVWLLSRSPARRVAATALLVARTAAAARTAVAARAALSMPSLGAAAVLSADAANAVVSASAVGGTATAASAAAF